MSETHIELQAFERGHLALATQELASPLLASNDTIYNTHAPPPLTGPDVQQAPVTSGARWDSFSYGAWHSVVYDAFMAAKHRWYFRKVTALRWTVNFLIGNELSERQSRAHVYNFCYPRQVLLLR